MSRRTSGSPSGEHLIVTETTTVEDDGDIRAMLARGLSAEGFAVDLAGGVDEALAAARRDRR